MVQRLIVCVIRWSADTPSTLGSSGTTEFVIVITLYCNRGSQLWWACSVFLHVYLKNHTSKLHQIFCACCLWPWLGPLASLYTLYVLPVLWITSCFLIIGPKWFCGSVQRLLQPLKCRVRPNSPAALYLVVSCPIRRLVPRPDSSSFKGCWSGVCACTVSWPHQYWKRYITKRPSRQVCWSIVMSVAVLEHFPCYVPGYWGGRWVELDTIDYFILMSLLRS